MIEIKHRYSGRVLKTINTGTLYGANLSGADLCNADLNGADLRGANLSGADLYGANLRGAQMIISAGTPYGYTAYGWVFEGYLMIRVGCKEKRLADVRKYWKGKIYRREVLAAVEYIAAVAKARGWKLNKPRK